MFLVSHCSGPRGTRPRAVDCGATYSFALARLSNIIFINRKAYFHTFTQTQKSPKLSCCEGFSPKREKVWGHLFKSGLGRCRRRRAWGRRSTWRGLQSYTSLHGAYVTFWGTHLRCSKLTCTSVITEGALKAIQKWKCDL